MSNTNPWSFMFFAFMIIGLSYVITTSWVSLLYRLFGVLILIFYLLAIIYGIIIGISKSHIEKNSFKKKMEELVKNG